MNNIKNIAQIPDNLLLNITRFTEEIDRFVYDGPDSAIYFPDLVWDNIRDYLGIWETTYNKIVKKLPKSDTISRYPTAVAFYYINEFSDFSSEDIWIIQRQIRETRLLKNQHGYNIATYWIEPYIQHHNRVMRGRRTLKDYMED